MRAFGEMAIVSLVLLAAFEQVASACPFCGGKGASGLFENLLIVGALWFGARGLMRAMQRRRSRERPPAPESPDHSSSPSATRTAS
jgi:hypothetical protein